MQGNIFRKSLKARMYCPVIVILLLVLIGAVRTSDSDISIVNAASSDVVSTINKSAMCSVEDCFKVIVERVSPGVVSITAYQKASPDASIERQSAEDKKSAGPLDDFFHRFYGEDGSFMGVQIPDIASRLSVPVRASGSGTIVRREGASFYILTNYHVVEDAYQVDVRLDDNSDLKGTVVGLDSVTDIAVVRISSPKLSDKNIVPMGDSNAVKVGSWALAMGSPYGFDQTLTVGIVSALHRELDEEDASYPDLIQTDAAINKGNSGGPLLDAEGRLIGVNTAIASPTGGSIGLGFAIPANVIKTVLDDLIRDGRVVRGWLGVGIQELTPVLQEYYGVNNGVLVSSIEERSPASRMGLSSEDVVTSVGGTRITDSRQLQRMVSDTKPGTPVSVVIMRGGKEYTLKEQIGMSPATPSGRPTAPAGESGPGIRVRTITDEIARAVGLKTVKGVIVISLWPGVPAEEAGLTEGDVITSFNGRAISTEKQFSDIIDEMHAGDIIVLRVMRDNTPRMIGFRIE